MANKLPAWTIGLAPQPKGDFYILDNNGKHQRFGNVACKWGLDDAEMNVYKVGDNGVLIGDPVGKCVYIKDINDNIRNMYDLDYDPLQDGGRRRRRSTCRHRKSRKVTRRRRAGRRSQRR